MGKLVLTFSQKSSKDIAIGIGINSFKSNRSTKMKIFLVIWVLIMSINSTYSQSIKEKEVKKIKTLGHKCAEGNAKSCSMLADIAKNDQSQFIREAAVVKITDQNVLNDIAKNDKESNVRNAAVNNITDQNILIDLAENANDTGVRISAVRKIGYLDQERLLSFIKNCNNNDVLRASIKEIRDQNDLTNIVQSDNIVARQIALERIDDKWVLEKIANSKFNSIEIRKAAVEKITDEFLLNKIIRGADIIDVKIAAIQRITDQSILKNIVIFEEDPAARIAAINKISDQSVLEEVVIFIYSDPIVKVEAIQRITDQNILEDIARSQSYNSDVRIAAIQRITDQNILEDIARSHPYNSSVRIAAINKISNQSVLLDIAKKDDGLSVLKALTNKITDQSVKANIEKKINKLEQWQVKVLKMTSSNKVSVLVGFETAPVGSRWLMIDVEFTAPEASLEPQDIKIKDKMDNIYSAVGLCATPKLNESPKYGSFDDWESKGVIDKNGDLEWMVAYGKLEVLKTLSLKISFLFVPPSGTKPTLLIFGKKVVVLPY